MFSFLRISSCIFYLIDDYEEGFDRILETVEEKPVYTKIVVEEEEAKPDSCDKSGMLYLLQPASHELPYTAATNCSRYSYQWWIPKCSPLNWWLGL